MNFELPSDYDSLLVHYNALRVELDLANQSVHNHKTTLKIKQALEQDLNDEINMLRRISRPDSHVKTIQHLREELSYLKKNNEDRFCNYEQELEKRDREIEELRSQLEAAKKLETAVQETDDRPQLLEEIEKLRMQLEDLEAERENSEEMYIILETEANTLRNKYKELSQELESVTEILSIKKTELQEANAVIETQKEELFVVKSELDTLKSKPLSEESKGNSLFAEVNDRRVHLEDTMKKMKVKYMEMKSKYDSKSEEVKKVREDNLKLIGKLQNEIAKQHEEVLEKVERCYEDKIRMLNQLIDSYKKELDEKYDAQKSIETSVFNNLMDMKNKELADLRSYLQVRTLHNTLLVKDLAAAKRDAKHHQLQCMKLENDIETQTKHEARVAELEKQVEELKEELERLQELTVPKSILKCSPLVSECVITAEDKENHDENRKVTFTADTIDSSKITMRRKCKTVITKPIHFD